MTTDSDLLRRYSEQGDEAAFAEIVHRHVNLVHASAVRLLQGNATLAQDVTQSVFTDLARKAATLTLHASVAGWLHTSVRFAASSAVRNEQRRLTFEQKASAMIDLLQADDATTWTQLRPFIDEAVGELQAHDRDAVLLRFFEDKSHREVGEALGLTENAARMRVDRAVEKLRAYFVRHGVTTTTALLTTTLGTQAASAPAPAGLTAAVVGKSLAWAVGTKVAGGKIAGTLASKMKAILVGATVLATTAAAAVLYLRSESSAPPPPQKTVAAVVKPSVAISSPTPMAMTNSTVDLGATTLAAAPIATAPVAVQIVDSAVQTGNSADSSTPAQLIQQVTQSDAPSDSTTTTAQDGSTPSQKSEPSPKPKSSLQMAPTTGIATWGRNYIGQLGDGNIEKTGANAAPSNPPVLVKESGALKGKTVIAIASGERAKLALCSDNTLVTWGDNTVGQLGTGKDDLKSSNVPVLVDRSGALKGKTITAISAGESTTSFMVLCSDGTVCSWGANPGHSRPSGWSFSPRLVNTGSMKTQKVIAMTGGGEPMFLCSDGSLYSYEWTPNNLYVLVKKDGTGALKGKTITAISGGDQHKLALCSDGTLVFWGSYDTGLIPKGEVEYNHGRDPIALHLDGSLKSKAITAIAQGSHEVMTLFADGTLAIWPWKTLAVLQWANFYGAPAPGGPFVTLGKSFSVNGKTYNLSPQFVDSTNELSPDNKIVAIAGGSHDNYAWPLAGLCSDGTLILFGGVGTIAQNQIKLVDSSGVLKGKTIRAFTPDMALFANPTPP